MGTKRINRSHIEIDIGMAIRRARVAAGLTQEALALALNVTYQQVQNYEKGSGRISASSLKMASDFLNVPVEDLFKPEVDVGKEYFYEVKGTL